jgi:hypothetical protein
MTDGAFDGADMSVFATLIVGAIIACDFSR